MSLFHKYYNRKLQFSADLVSLLTPMGRKISVEEASALAERYGMDGLLTDSVLQLLLKAQILTMESDGLILNRDWPWQIPPIPTARIEESYLQMILQLPHASTFLENNTIAKLLQPGQSSRNSVLVSFPPAYEQEEPPISPSEFQLLLHAIEHGIPVRYQYRTRDNPEFTSSVGIPWKLEFCAYDGRWWVIFYLPAESRTVKAWLPNISSLEYAKDIPPVSPDEIKNSYQALLAPEPLRLRISPKRQALERCFMVLEKLELISAQLCPEGYCEATFRYYRFNEQEILRQLLYLGPAVRLCGPRSMCIKQLNQVRKALAHFHPAPENK